MKFEQPSRIQGITLPLILNEPNHSLIAQVSNGHVTPALHTQLAHSNKQYPHVTCDSIVIGAQWKRQDHLLCAGYAQ